MSLTDLSKLNEKNGFQKIFLHHMIDDNGFVESFNKDYNLKYAIDEKCLFEYLEKSQPKDFKKLQNVDNYRIEFVKYLRDEIHRKGLLEVLRNPVKFYGAHFDMVGFKPATQYGQTATLKYESNIFSITEELVYNKIDTDESNAGRGDLTIFINGIPILWFELKCNTSGQTVSNAIKQYRLTRSPKEQVFKFNEGCLVDFAMDLDDVFFTTKLNGESTFFMPYNKGVNNHKGNPDVKDDVRTSYMWKEILTKDNILQWLEEYIILEKKTEIGFNKQKKNIERLIFPRYHQFHEVTEIVKDVKNKGVAGQNYLVMDSPGSGKTFSIAWLAYHLASLHNNSNENIYDSIIVITDRLVVDSQLQDAINEIPHEPGEVKFMDNDCSSEDLAKAINDNEKIIVSTIQKFSYILSKVSPNSSKKYAIIIDECHSSTKGDYIGNTIKSLSAKAENEDDEEIDGQDFINDEMEKDIARNGKPKNITFFGFSATPKKKTLEKFGTEIVDSNGNPVLDEKGRPIYKPFTCYSMQQAIDEGFILDVLKNYTIYKTYFEINKLIKDNPEFNKDKTQKAIYRYAMLHPTNIQQKIEIIIEHFREHIANFLDGNAKAMVVTDSREAAVRYKLEFDKYIKSHNIENIHALVAFTGKLKLKETNEREYSEPNMNGMPEKDTADAFNTSDYQVLLVANKYQTGYDQPLLCAMYIDKILTGINAVQTLGRLNRVYPGKDGNIFILDFRNTYQDMIDAFKPYYAQLTLIGKTNPNDIYKLEEKIDAYTLTTTYDIDTFIALTLKSKLSDKEKSEWYSYLSKAKTVYNQIKDDKEKKKLRKTIKMFVEGYSWINQTTSFDDPDLHKKWIFYKEFIKRLANEGDGGAIDPSTLVTIDNINQKLKEEIKTKNTKIEPITIAKIGKMKVTISTDIVFAKIEELIKEMNEIFNDHELDENTTSGIIYTLIKVLAEDEEVRRRAQNNSPEDFRLFLKDKLEDILFESRKNSNKFFKDALDNDDVEKIILDFLNNIVYNEAREKVKNYQIEMGEKK